jgi:hypothetical protein
MPHRPGHTGQTAPGTGQMHPTGREGSGPGILEKIMAMLSGGSRINPETDTAEDAYRFFAPPVDEPFQADLKRFPPRGILGLGNIPPVVNTPSSALRRTQSQLQPEMQGQETGDAGTGALLESIASMLQNPEFLAMQTEGPIPHAFEAGRQLDTQRNEPERLLRQLLERYGAEIQGSKSIPDTRTQGINLIREGGPALEARDQSRVGRPRFTPSRAGVR